MPKINQEEYEYKTGIFDWATALRRAFHGESEETEVKKDIEWLKDRILRSKGTCIFMRDNSEPHGGGRRFYSGMITSIDLILGFIDQLDELEVLSQEWIEEHTYYEDEYDFYYADPDELKNLLVPKHEELESKIKVLIEAYKQEDGAYSNPENGWISGFVKDLENLVEEEQKYYVDLDMAAYVAKLKDDDRVDIYTDGISGSDEYEFHLTEEEIKNYDERFWPFAKPVEELEE